MGRDFPAADLAGSLYTQRKLCTDFDYVEICLDKSEYLGLTDYELELEYTADYPEKPLEILKNAGITQGEAVIGKYARFMERAKSLVSADFRLSAVIFYEKAPTACKGLGNNDN